MAGILSMIRLGMIKVLRKYSFLVIFATAIFLGVLCVPSASAGYVVFDLGGVRGLYNSAWLGVLGAMLCSILLWLPGFYLLRSQITEDVQLRMQQIIMATPIRKIKYLSLKAGTNFLVLVMLQGLFLMSFIIMQIIRNEDLNIAIIHYIAPFIFVSLPALCVAAALSIFFDVIPFLKGAIGNVIIFIIWILGSSMSVALPQNPYDLFGIGFLLNQLLQSVKHFYPDVSTSVGSFGYYPIDRTVPTFYFDGVAFRSDFLAARLMWLGIAILIIVISAILFNRIKVRTSVEGLLVKRNTTHPLQVAEVIHHHTTIELPGVRRTSKPAFLRSICLELKILLPTSVWWYIAVIISEIICFLLPANLFLRWSSLILLLPIGIWSKLGCHEKLNRTESFMITSCSPVVKWWLSFLSGMIIAFMLSVPILIRFMLLSYYHYIVFWMIGVTFVSSFAMTLSRMSGNTRLFEAIYIIIFYIGEINGLRAFDFLGLMGSNMFYLYAGFILIIISHIFEFGKRGRLR